MLFKDSNKLKEYAQLSGQHNFPEIKASLRMVEQKYIVPILGKELYNDLNEAYGAAATEADLTEEDQNLLYQCRMAIGPLFIYFHADKADISFTAAGMQRLESATNKSAYQEQRTKFKEANLTEGEQALELLIEFLEDNIDDYPEWTASTNFKKYRSLFIKTGTEFNELFPSQSPHRNYFAMRSKMLDVEENNIRSFLGDTLFDALKDKAALAEPDFTTKELVLLFKIKKVIANFTVAFSAHLLNVRISSNGITVPAITTFSQNDNENTRAGIDDKSIVSLITSCTNTGTDWLNNANKYLTDNQTEFATWIGFAEAEEEDANSLNADRNGNVFGA